MKISVVVPVYNAEKYLKKCVESVIAQTYTDWEMILVDDGSKDASADIVDEYAGKDTRIRAIHQKNAGPGMARNAGIRNALGEYIVFLDSDDMVTPDYFEKLSRETADVVFIDIDQVDEHMNILCEEHMSSYHLLSKDDFLRNQLTGKILWGGTKSGEIRTFERKKD